MRHTKQPTKKHSKKYRILILEQRQIILDQETYADLFIYLFIYRQSIRLANTWIHAKLCPISVQNIEITRRPNMHVMVLEGSFGNSTNLWKFRVNENDRSNWAEVELKKNDCSLKVASANEVGILCNRRLSNHLYFGRLIVDRLGLDYTTLWNKIYPLCGKKFRIYTL